MREYRVYFMCQMWLISTWEFHSSTITVDPLELKIFVKTEMSQTLSLSKQPVIYNMYNIYLQKIFSNQKKGG